MIKRSLPQVEVRALNQSDNTITVECIQGARGVHIATLKRGQDVLVTEDAIKITALGKKRKVANVVVKGIIKDIKDNRVIVEKGDTNLVMQKDDIRLLVNKGASLKLNAID